MLVASGAWLSTSSYGAESLDPFVALQAVEAAESELERAYALCPTDHRIPAWLGPIKIRMGRMLEDSAVVDEGFKVLEQGIQHYPGFVLFSKLLVYADLPASDPEFRKALDAVRENAKYCGTVATGLSSDPACHDHPHASHNIEGSAVFLGDMYAKAQDRAAALAAYESAEAVPSWDSWDYRELLEQRIKTLDTRMAAELSPDTSDDVEEAWASQIQCSLCHRE
jgi:tetratricopeptide (TPR) repeat protein